ncbi:MAG: ABC transporter ATP-binding protein [Spirochaetales bacterium]|nr:ABC transporter ATP-binding protein [Spirochaetales bacterium]
MLRFCDVGYRIGGTCIIDSVSFEAGEGEFIGLIGPNGSGKTTLLRLADRLISPTKGYITLKGKPLHRYTEPELATHCSFMQQEGAVGFNFTVSSVVMFGRYPYRRWARWETEEDREKVRRALDYVGLHGFEERPILELSGGERQLVFFAMTLVQETEVLLLDEPTSNLDIKHQQRIFSMAEELCREKKTIIAAIHNLNEASRYCSRLVLLDEGRIAADGKPDNVIAPGLIDRVYGVKTDIGINTSTGSRLVSVVPRRAGPEGPRVHLIGGAGSAVNLTRELFRLGFRITGGIAHVNDTDAMLWRSLGIETVTTAAFSEIDGEAVSGAVPYVVGADFTILCSFPVGEGNAANLELAGKARRLIIVEPDEYEERAFFSGRAETMFMRLREGAALLTYSEIIRMFEEMV